MKRHGYIIGGQVQGVGFRPFVYRAATRLRLTGHVGNTSDGVRVEVQGTDEALAAFAHALEHELPPLARITSLRREELPLADGEAAFYGPKLDIQIKNVHGKEDTLITIQIDFQLAEKFGTEYVDRDNKRKYPYVIHRTSIGCYERTLALLIEKYAGAFPLWLAPEQARVILISDDRKPYAEEVLRTLKDAGLRASLDDRNEKLGFKADLRDYGVGAQILLDLGIRKLRIMTNNPRKIVGLEGYGIEIVGREPIEVGCCATNEEYMRTKQEKMGHMLHVSGDSK